MAHLGPGYRGLSCVHLTGVAQQQCPPTECPGPSSCLEWEAWDTGAGLDGCLFHATGWHGHCPALRCRVGLKGEAALGPSLRRASEPEAGRVGIGHSPGPGLHPQDPDLEGGPGCAEAQSSLKHRFSCAFWTKSPPQPLPSGQPCPAAPGPGKTLCKVI